MDTCSRLEEPGGVHQFGGGPESFSAQACESNGLPGFSVTTLVTSPVETGGADASLGIPTAISKAWACLRTNTFVHRSDDRTTNARADSMVSRRCIVVWPAHLELSPKVGDVGNREGGISWGCLTPPLLHRRSDMPCPRITSSS